jgi:Raf kinase inhibitor-like YbhB/YbcL family protein
MKLSYAKNTNKYSFLVVAVVVLALICAAAILIKIRSSNMETPAPSNGMQLISTAFNDGEEIPEQYTCKGTNINPPLTIMNPPAGTKSLALIMHDPDAPGTDFVHWLVWDVPANTQSIGPNSVPVGAVQGTNSFGKNNYGGPCPPAGTGTHHYIFELYALGTNLSLGADSNREKLQDALQDHTLAQANLTGIMAPSN